MADRPRKHAAPADCPESIKRGRGGLREGAGPKLDGPAQRKAAQLAGIAAREGVALASVVRAAVAAEHGRAEEGHPADLLRRWGNRWREFEAPGAGATHAAATDAAAETGALRAMECKIEVLTARARDEEATSKAMREHWANAPTPDPPCRCLHTHCSRTVGGLRCSGVAGAAARNVGCLENGGTHHLAGDECRCVHLHCGVCGATQTIREIRNGRAVGPVIPMSYVWTDDFTLPGRYRVIGWRCASCGAADRAARR